MTILMLVILFLSICGFVVSALELQVKEPREDRLPDASRRNLAGAAKKGRQRTVSAARIMDEVSRRARLHGDLLSGTPVQASAPQDATTRK